MKLDEIVNLKFDLFEDAINGMSEKKLDELLSQLTKIKTGLYMVEQICIGENNA